MPRSLALIVGSVIAALLAVPCAAQQPAPDTAPPAPRGARARSPALAGVLAVYPGLGHVYAGEWRRGLEVYAGTFGAVGAGAFTMIASPPDGSCFMLDCSGRQPRWVNRVVFAGGVAVAAVGVTTWVRSAIDAPRAAGRTNRRRGLGVAPRLRPDVYVAAAPTGATHVGLALTQ